MFLNLQNSINANVGGSGGGTSNEISKSHADGSNVNANEVGTGSGADVVAGTDDQLNFAGEKGSIVDGQPNILEFDFEFLKDNVGFQYKFPEKLFRRPANGQTLETAEFLLQQLHFR